MLDHHRYETELRLYFSGYMAHRTLRQQNACRELTAVLEELHDQYMAAHATMGRDARYILRATELLMASCLPT